MMKTMSSCLRLLSIIAFLSSSVSFADGYYSDFSDAQLYQRLAAAESRLNECIAAVSSIERKISEAENGISMMTVPDYLFWKKELARQKTCIQKVSGDIEKLKKEIFNRLKIASQSRLPDHDLERAKAKAKEIRGAINRVNNKINDLLKRMHNLEQNN